MQNKRLWIALAVTFFASFAVLGFVGSDIYREAPPIPNQVVANNGEIIFSADQIKNGQNVWQSAGGQELGSIWGHGAYVAPDWSADWLHREAVAMLDVFAREQGAKDFASMRPEQQASIQHLMKTELRTNTYDVATGTITVSPQRAAVIKELANYYARLFGNDQELRELRKAYAMRENTVGDELRQQQLGAFFFWTSWAAVTNKPGSDISYLNNWPHEPLVDNVPTSDAFLWTFLSIVFLLIGIGALAWHTAVQHRDEHVEAPKINPLSSFKATPSMKATKKYFWTVMGLILLQVLLGIVTAHYGVEGQSFYGYNISEWIPYALTRTWHTQLGIFWIATAWLATGLYIAPMVTGYEPKFQRFGVNLLWVCLLIIVLGSMAGQWFGIQQKLGHEVNFWFGHQGYEYVDLGRFWQIFLFAGLFIWLGLMIRPMVPALRQPSEHRQLLSLFTLSTLAIALFYGAGLMWGQHTHLAVAEYWRWWVVHLWVEGFFEVFATSIIAYLFVRMGLLQAARATTAVLFATIVFLAGGILGTFHHLYFSGTPTSVLALGASFSALEVVPLSLIGFEAYSNYKLSRGRGWVADYKWPILFFVAVAFWNLLGAGVFGFLINPPLSLYYMQGLNTTPVHGHTALFGVYGMLGIGLMLFCMRGMTVRRAWDERWLKAGFWSLNGGLVAMVVFSLLPVGILQTMASVETGLWYARSAEFLNTPLMTVLKWLRAPGDTLFAVGIGCLAVFFVKTWLPPRRFGAKSRKAVPTPELQPLPVEVMSREKVRT